jgi:hypothetical protein
MFNCDIWFKQLACDILWGEATFINQLWFWLRGDVKDLLFTLPTFQQIKSGRYISCLV